MCLLLNWMSYYIFINVHFSIIYKNRTVSFYFNLANPLGILIANLVSPALVSEGKDIPTMVMKAD